ncbi:MAG TPA: hypothetical protein VIE13_04505, partial [Terriglobales bacterium]
MRKFWAPVGISVLLGGLIAVGWTACGGSSAVKTSPTVTNVTLSDPATCAGPSGPYSHVYVTVTDVQASTSAAG